MAKDEIKTNRGGPKDGKDEKERNQRNQRNRLLGPWARPGSFFLRGHRLEITWKPFI